jgi:two-component system LytT family response regulator
MSKLTTILIDDEQNALNVLSSLIEASGLATVLSTETNPNLAFRQIMVKSPDVVFLDIDMPDKDGITLLKEIKDLSDSTKVIMVTAHDEYVIEAFRNSAYDYLLKPIDNEDLIAVLERLKKDRDENKSAKEEVVEKMVVEETNDKVSVTFGDKKVLLMSEDIVYLQADGSSTDFRLKDDRLRTSIKGIGTFESILPKKFFRISRSAIINVDYVTTLFPRRKSCVLTCSEKEYELSVSRARYYDLERLLTS